jgi:hypothetical protein
MTAVFDFVETLFPGAPPSLDPTPLILSIGGRSEGCLTRSAVFLIVKNAFGQAAHALAASDPVTAIAAPGFHPLAAPHRSPH